MYSYRCYIYIIYTIHVTDDTSTTLICHSNQEAEDDISLEIFLVRESTSNSLLDPRGGPKWKTASNGIQSPKITNTFKKQ
jgi:hypothetical protein